MYSYSEKVSKFTPPRSKEQLLRTGLMLLLVVSRSLIPKNRPPNATLCCSTHTPFFLFYNKFCGVHSTLLQIFYFSYRYSHNFRKENPEPFEHLVKKGTLVGKSYFQVSEVKSKKKRFGNVESENCKKVVYKG